jgi:dynein light chain LC8-type
MSLHLEERIIDLDDNVKNLIIDILKKAFSEQTNEKDIADYVRRSLEEKDEGKWNIVLGKDFGTHIVHKSRKYGLFQVGELQILIWQTG